MLKQLSELPLKFNDFEKWLSRHVTGNEIVKIGIKYILQDELKVETDHITFKYLLRYQCEHHRLIFIYDSKAQRLLSLPNDDSRYLTFFKSVYELFTHYHRLNETEKTLVNRLCHVFTGNTVRPVVSGHIDPLWSWIDHYETVKFAKRLLESGRFKEICELCNETIEEVTEYNDKLKKTVKVTSNV